MTSLSAYLAPYGTHRDATGLTMKVRIRLWHPAFWATVWRLLDYPLWAKPAMWLLIMVRAVRGTNAAR